MAGSARRIVVEFLGDGKNLSGELNSLQGKTSKFGSVMGKIGKVAAVGLFAGAAAATAWGVESAKSLGRIERINTQTEQAIKSTGGAAGVTAKHIEHLTGRLESLTATEAETTQENANLLLTFTNVKNEAGKGNDVFDQTVSTFVDMQRAMPNASMVALGKALNDPVKGITALTRVGVSFTEQQQDQIKKLSESGKTMQAQKIILGELNKEFGGSGAAFAKTTEGQIELAKHSFGTLGETVFQALAPLAGKAASAVTGWINDAIPLVKHFFGEWKEGVGVGGQVRDAMGVVRDAFANAWGAIKPVLENLGDWLKSDVVPAVQDFVGEMKSGEGAGGKFADALQKVRGALEKTWEILQPVFTFMADNKTVVATFAGVILTVVAAVKVWTAVQTALNIVMSANPLGLVAVAIAALAAGLVYAYKKSETFRDVVDTVFGAVGKIMRSFWNDFAQPILHFLVEAIAQAAEGFADMLDGLSHVPGFGWVKGAADGLHKAAEQGKAFADQIQKIPEHKSVTVDLIVNRSAMNKNQDVLGDPAGRTLFDQGGAGGGKFDKLGLGGNNLGGAGAALVGSIVNGIRKGKVPLQKALDELGDYIKKHQDKLKDLLSKRDSIVEAFRGMTSSIFGTDLSADAEGNAPTIQRLLDAGAQKAAAAKALAANVQSLLSKGLSKDLLQQMIDAGEAGAEQIALLASGTQSQIDQANANNEETRKALEAAGLAVGDAIYGAQIEREQDAIRQADIIRDKLQELLDLQDKNTIVELHLDGQKIYVSLKKLKKQLGHGLGLDD